MNKWTIVVFIVICLLKCNGRTPFKPKDGSMPFMVYYPSRYRGLCVGTLVSQTAVITAAVCVTNPVADIKDRRPLNVVIGTHYRHPRRGIRVQVTKILIPNLLGMNISTENRGYLMEKAAAVLLLKRKVPHVLMEIPPQPIAADWKGEQQLILQEDCLTAGWHFHYKGDKIYEPAKFLLQRNLRVQFMNIVKKDLWCQALNYKFVKSLTNLGIQGRISIGTAICLRDSDRVAQPCHGMYGAPLICRGYLVGVMMAPDAQWTNCTGLSNMFHLLSNEFLIDFMGCVNNIFEPELSTDWKLFKQSIYADHTVAYDYDYVNLLYDKLYGEESSTSEEV